VLHIRPQYHRVLGLNEIPLFHHDDIPISQDDIARLGDFGIAGVITDPTVVGPGGNAGGVTASNSELGEVGFPRARSSCKPCLRPL